ncbi:hypothetical protein D3C78_1287610 [compost metagenome]
MQGDEPEVREAGAQQWVEGSIVAAGGEPVEKGRQLLLQALARRRLEMHGGTVEAPGHHLHRLLAAQGADADAPWQQVEILLGEQQCVPVQQALRRQRQLELLGGVQHQLGQPLAARTDAGLCLGLQAQAAGQRGTHRTDVELFTLDGRGGDDVL